MKKTIKIKVAAIVMVLFCMMMTNISAKAGSTGRKFYTLSGNEVKVSTGAYSKTTSEQCSYTSPEKSGALPSVKCQTFCYDSQGVALTSNPVTVASKGETTYLGVYVTINLYKGQQVWMNQWTSSSGVTDMVYTDWDYR